MSSELWKQLLILATLFLVAIGVLTYRAMRNVSGASKKDWLIASATKAPAALLAVVASYGVSMFYLEAIPLWVSIIGAIAYESVYISLSLQATRKDLDRLRYSFVAFSAVGMSAISNSLYAFAMIYFAQTMISRSLVDLTGLQHVYVSAMLGVLHGAPLSVLSYNMLQLLASRGEKVTTVHAPSERARKLRRKPHTMRSATTVQPKAKEYATVSFASTVQSPFLAGVNQKTHDIVQLWNDGLKKAQVARQIGVSRTTVSNHLAIARQNGMQVRAE